MRDDDELEQSAEEQEVGVVQEVIVGQEVGMDDLPNSESLTSKCEDRGKRPMNPSKVSDSLCSITKQASAELLSVRNGN